nr:Gag-Pol polyprotein [Tanacetum cinerariifolium]
MKPKAGIGIFIGYSESSRGFRIYNRRTKKIMETIHVKFDEITVMASECNNLEPRMNRMNFQDSSKDSQSVPLKSDLDNLFGPMYEEYYVKENQEKDKIGSKPDKNRKQLMPSFNSILRAFASLGHDLGRSDFYEFTDELIPFISPPEYNCFLFKVEPNSRDFTKDVVEDISPTKEPQVHNALPTHPTLQLNMKFQPSSEYLFTYVVWIFLLFLVYSVARRYLLSLENEDTIFDPGICNSHFSRPDVSHRCGTFPRFKVLLERPMEIFSSTCSPMDK